MKIKILVLILLFGVNFGSKGQEIEGYRFVGSREYRYNHKGEKIEKRSFNANHQLESFVNYIFDVNGNKIESLKYSNDSVLLARYVYFFDAENYKIRSIKVDYKNDVETRKNYINNEKGENIRTEYFDADGLTKYSEVTYTDTGEFKSRKSFDRNGELSSAYDYEYLYKNGKILEKQRLSKAKLASKTVYEYDDNGFKTSYSSNYVSIRRTSKKRLYNYNEHEQCIQSLVYEKLKTK